jgi:ribonucleotide reductase alpha subunit
MPEISLNASSIEPIPQLNKQRAQQSSERCDATISQYFWSEKPEPFPPMTEENLRTETASADDWRVWTTDSRKRMHDADTLAKSLGG